MLIPSLWGRIEKRLVTSEIYIGLHPLGDIQLFSKTLLYKAFLFISAFYLRIRENHNINYLISSFTMVHRTICDAKIMRLLLLLLV